MTTSVRHPFSKLKKGMRVRVETNNVEVDGVLLDKHNGTQTLTVLPLGGDVSLTGVPYDLYLITPEAHPLDQVHPMLAKDLAKRPRLTLDALLADPAWALEEKYDGERQILTFVPEDAVALSLDFSEFVALVNPETFRLRKFRATTRVVGKNSGRLATNSETVQHLGKIPVPENGVTVLDVELMHKDGFQTLRGIMGSLPARALELQAEKGQVYAVVFDALWFNGQDLRGLTFRERRTILEEWFVYEGAEGEYTLVLSPLEWDEASKRSLLERILANGGEGAMLKYKHAPYTDTTKSGQRSEFLLKVKPFQEDDVIIYGFEQGRGEYNQHKFGAIKFAQLVPRRNLTPEMVGNVVHPEEHPHLIGSFWSNPIPDFGYSLVHMGSCSGITDEQESAFREDPESFYARVMEVRFQSRWPDTGLCRHPSFVRMRDDKSAVECMYGRDV